MAVTIRLARQEDQPTIVFFIRQAKLNPRNQHWQNFLIAEENDQTVGVRQVKTPKLGTREVASGFVVPEYRRQGISVKIMDALLARETRPLYTMVNEERVPYYAKVGFRQVSIHQLPANFRAEYRIGRLVTSLLSIFRKENIRIVPFRRG